MSMQTNNQTRRDQTGSKHLLAFAGGLFTGIGLTILYQSRVAEGSVEHAQTVYKDSAANIKRGIKGSIMHTASKVETGARTVHEKVREW